MGPFFFRDLEAHDCGAYTNLRTNYANINMRMSSQRLIALSVWIALAILTGSPVRSVYAETAPDLTKLSPESAEFASRTLDFIDQMNGIYFAAAARLNGDDNRIEHVELDTENGYWDTQVARGPVIEKAGRTITVIKKPTFQADTLWSRYLVLAAHPKSPLVGTMQASFVVEFHKDGNSMVAGMIDVMPAATSAEDLAEIKSAVEAVYQAHGMDGDKYRRQSCTASAEEMNVEHRRKAACVGGNFFGRNPMAVTDANLEFMTEIYQTFVESFLAIVEKRQNDAYTDADLALQDEMRRGWLEDRLFADPNTTQFAPWEAWSLYSLPPIVKF